MAGFLPSRRRFLGGAGVCIGLPFLESALPKHAWGQAAPVVKRWMSCFIPNGVDKRAWPTVAANAADFTVPAITAPLAPMKRKVTILENICNPGGFGAHEKAIRSFLTSQSTDGGDDNDGRGISVDQAIANLVGKETRIASLQVGVEPDSYRYVSWRAAKQPLPPVTDPLKLFNTVFAGFDSNLSMVEIERRRRYDTSILDYAVGEIAQLQPRLGKSDRTTLESYTTSLRELETRIKSSTSFAACNLPSSPAANSNSLPNDQKWRLMYDLSVAALACDATRVISFYPGMTNSSAPWIGVAQGHHDLSHWGSDVSKRDKVQLIDIWEVQQFTRLIQALDAIDEGGGRTLLDNSMVYLSSEIDEGDGHGDKNLPFVMAGTLGGAFPNTGGKILRMRGPTTGGVMHSNGNLWPYSGNMPQSWFFVSCINAFGGNVTQFGADVAGDMVKSGQLA